MKKSANAFFCAAAALMFSACVVDQRIIGPDDPGGGNGEANVAFTLNLRTPGGFAPPAATRALTYDGEVALDDVRVLVFNDEGSKLLTIEFPEVLTQPSGPNRRGDISLELAAFTGSRQLVVITNVDDLANQDLEPEGAAPDGVSENGVGKIILDLLMQQDGGTDVSKEDVVAALSAMRVVGYLWDDEHSATNALPMWGETEVTVTVNGEETEIEAGDVHLMRAVARIDVGVGTPGGGDHGQWTWNGKDKDNKKIPFELKSVHVIRSTPVWAAIPYAANFEGATLKKPTVPIPSTDPAFGTPSEITAAVEAALLYDGLYPEGSETPVPVVTPSKDGNGSYITRTVYIPEADVLSYPGGVGSANYTKRPALVVGGLYDANDDGDYEDTGEDVINYYRIDFKNDAGLFDVLRNHLYQFNIADVTGEGKPTVEEAYKSEAMNMVVNVLDWNESNNDVEWVGQHFFSFGERPVVFTPVAQSRQVTLRTNLHEGFTMTLGTAPSQVTLTAAANWAVGDSDTYLETGPNANFGYTLTLAVKPGSPDGVYEYTLDIAASKNWGPDSEIIKSKIDTWDIVLGDARLSTWFRVEQEWSNKNPTLYKVTLVTPSPTDGTAMASHKEAPEDERVELIATPYAAADPRKAFIGWTFTRADGPDDGTEPDEFTPVFDPVEATTEGNPLKFVMPAHDVTVTPAFVNWVEPSVSPTRLVFVENENYPGRGQNVTVTATHRWTVTVPDTYRVGPMPEPNNLVPDAAYISTYATTTTYSGIGSTGFRVWPAAANGGTEDKLGTAVVTIDDRRFAVALKQRPPIGGSDDILYFENMDGDTRLMVGKWRNASTGGIGDFDNTDVMAFFKFGGVVGSNLGADGDTWDAPNDLKFNPTNSTVSQWGSSNNAADMTLSSGYVPGYLSTEGIAGLAPTGTTDQINNSKIVSSPEYHSIENLLAGKGDPCQLAGLSVAEIKDALIEGKMPVGTGGWRTPTNVENQKFYGSASDNGATSVWTGGTSSTTNTGYRNFQAGTGAGGYLPAAGSRRGSGAEGNLGTYGYYWSSTPDSATSGYGLGFNGTDVNPSTGNNYQNGYAIRCVRDEGFRPPLEPGPGDFTGDPDDWTDKDLENEL